MNSIEWMFSGFGTTVSGALVTGLLASVGFLIKKKIL